MNAPLMTLRRLQGEATTDFFLRHLEAGGATDAVLNISVLKKGRFGAVVPKSANAHKVAEYETGGLIRAEPALASGAISVQAIPDAVPEMSTIIAERLRLFHDPVLWVHEALLEEQSIASNKARCERLDGQLYLVYEKDLRTRERIADLIRYSNLSWHFLAFLTDHVHQASSASRLVQQAQMIILGAYDGESFLLWERSRDR